MYQLILPTLATVLLAGATPLTLAAQERTEQGRLENGDRRLQSGEYFDEYTFEGRPGQRVVLTLRSTEFDTYLILQAPSGEDTQNDDATEGETQRSLIEHDLTEPGTWKVWVTSFEPGETGRYTLDIRLTGGAPVASAAGGRLGATLGFGDQGAGAAAARTERGRLEAGDQTLEAGEYLDVYTLQGRRGEEITLDLRSTEFDPYLLFRGADGETEDNDDHEGDRTRSLIQVTLGTDGEYQVGVTSYQAGETGGYTLQVYSSGAQTAAVAAGPAAPVSERGELRAGDQTLRSGEYFDEYSFSGVPGQPVRIDLRTDAFDPYLIVIDPNDEHTENDDHEGSTSHSRVGFTLPEAGTYRVLVTSYQEGESGPYELTMASGAAATPARTAQGPAGEQRDLSRIRLGQTASGRLEAGDGQLDDGEYRDVFAFEGQAGQTIQVDMTSADFDTYLALVTPGGEDIQNDDYEGSTRHSRVELTLRASGRYRILATSYQAGETGAYELSLRGGGPAQVAAAPSSGGGGQIYGVFAGISDYGGRASNLAYTAEDAVRVREALMRGSGMQPENAVLLTDGQATRSNVQRAMQRLASRMGPDDTFVFFYSGHGSRTTRAGGFQVTDPDGMDETIELFDAGVTDDEFNDWVTGLNAGRFLLFLDACFSGGFSKDVISRPNRMGMFSSEEDVTSSVAAKFRAGGYLAVFLADAIADKLADSDGDGQINAIELSQYIHERYRADLKSAGPDEYVRTGGPQLGYQHLVVDRGSIGPYDVLFR